MGADAGVDAGADVGADTNCHRSVYLSQMGVDAGADSQERISNFSKADTGWVRLIRRRLIRSST